MSHSNLVGVSSSHSVGEKVATAFIVVVPFVAFIAGLFVWDSFDVVAAKILMLILYVITVLGVTVSYHRELTHRSLKLRPAARYTMAVSAGGSVEGGVFDWTTEHRMHHRFTDKKGDPHSPHEYGEGVTAVIKGFVHAHFGWFFRPRKIDYQKYVPDLLEDKGLVAIHKLFPVIAVLSFVLPGLVTLIFEPSWKGFFAGVFWGGFVRIFLVHHVTWSINSVCHLWGTRPFKSDDESTNNVIFGILGGGEGWHRNHHAFPTSARIGLRWWEIDWGWFFIRILHFFGQVEWIKVPTPEQMKAKMAR